jgi:hypothetical protein
MLQNGCGVKEPIHAAGVQAPAIVGCAAPEAVFVP